MPDALPVSQMPNGIGDYISFNTSGADGSLLSQAKQLGGDMVGTAKKFLGIEDEKLKKKIIKFNLILSNKQMINIVI